jgi:hypothetical protein
MASTGRWSRLSPEFANRVAGIVEALVTMKDDLDAEKRALQKQWAKREKQIEQAIGCTARMYGDFHGVIGATLPEIDGMALSRLDGGPFRALPPGPTEPGV